MTITNPEEMRFLIHGATSDGDALDAIEREMIEPSTLSDDAKSGLWLYAWSGAALGRGRRFVPASDRLLLPD